MTSRFFCLRHKNRAALPEPSSAELSAAVSSALVLAGLLIELLVVTAAPLYHICENSLR